MQKTLSQQLEEIVKKLEELEKRVEKKDKSAKKRDKLFIEILKVIKNHELISEE